MSQITGPPPLQAGPPPSPPAATRKAWYRRPALVIPLALAVTAAVAAALFLALRPTTITARGTVFDTRTGQAVISATLRADGKSAHTNTRGVFRLPGLPPGAKLSVQARYYATAQVKAASRPLRVRLAPIPVHVTVTSAITGKPLAAMLTPSHGTGVQARADGTATLYLTGPGEILTAATAGYRLGHAVINRDHTATLALDPTLRTMSRQLWAWANGGKYQAVVHWVLRPATGYILLPGVQHNLRGAPDPLTAYVSDNVFPSVNVSVSVFIARRGVHWDTPNTPVIFTGAALHPVLLTGQRAWHGGPDSNRQFDTWWSYDPVSVIATGSSQAKADAVMTGIIKAMTGTGQGT